MEFRVTQRGNLAAFVRQLQSFPEVFPRIMKNVEVRTMGLIAKGFHDQSAPSGAAWQPTVCGDHDILFDTGTLASSFKATTTARTVSITNGDEPKFSVHQNGKTIRAKNAPSLAFQCGGKWVHAQEVTIPARPMLPTRGLPPKWENRLLEGIEGILESWSNG